jgi:hypothetical protein
VVTPVTGNPTQTRTTVRVTAGRLGTAGLRLRNDGSRVIAVPRAPLAGPAPSVYTVEVRDDDRWTPLCLSPAATPCVISRTAGVFRVTASIATWQRSSEPVTWPAEQ